MPPDAILIVATAVATAALLIGLELYGIRRERLHAQRSRADVAERVEDRSFTAWEADLAEVFPFERKRPADVVPIRGLAGEAMDSDGLGASK